MGRRRKNRTHLKGGTASAPGTEAGVPKSFVIKHGQVGHSLAQLVRDVRKVMEPNTASRLRERARNKLKDFFVMAPALSVTHILAFTLTDVAPSLRIVRLSAGPTLSFRVERYSLVKDVSKISRRARSIGNVEYLSPPLLVLASFPPPSPTTPPHLTLLMKSFQTLFPPLAPQSLSLSSARRIVLVAYNAERDTVDFRHYLITVKPYGVSRRVRRVLEGTSKHTPAAGAGARSLLDLSSEKDVADFFLRARGSDGYESAASSASSAAGDDDGADAVALADDYVGRNNRKGQKRAVRLDEIGPRMELRLIKIAEGLPGAEGSVIYHGLVQKSKAEVAAQKAEHVAKEKLRKQRREEQEQNIQRKKALAKGKDVEADDDEDAEDREEEAENGEEYEDDGVWNDEEEISGGEESDSEDERDEDGSESEEEAPRPPPKKQKVRGKR